MSLTSEVPVEGESGVFCTSSGHKFLMGLRGWSHAGSGQRSCAEVGHCHLQRFRLVFLLLAQDGSSYAGRVWGFWDKPRAGAVIESHRASCAGSGEYFQRGRLGVAIKDQVRVSYK